jgi:hypothetical protein
MRSRGDREAGRLEAIAANTRQLRRRRQIEAIYHRGGLRPIVEFLEELLRRGLVDEDEINRRLASYAALNPLSLHVTGGNRLAPLPLWRPTWRAP